jgi:hypothetical protein
MLWCLCGPKDLGSSLKNKMVSIASIGYIDTNICCGFELKRLYWPSYLPLLFYLSVVVYV